MLLDCFPLTFNPNPNLDPEPQPASRGQPKTQFQAPKLRFCPPQALEPLTLNPNPELKQPSPFTPDPRPEPWPLTLTLSLFKPKTEPRTQAEEANPGRKQTKTQFQAPKLRFSPPSPGTL